MEVKGDKYLLLVRSYVVYSIFNDGEHSIEDHIALPIRVPTSGMIGGGPAMGSPSSTSGLFGPRSEQSSQADILKKEAFRLVSRRYL